METNKSTSVQVVKRMFDAFAEGNVRGILETVSDDSLWIYHGTQIIPKSRFSGKDGVEKFFTNILERTEVISFETRQYIVEGEMVVVLGSEHQRTKRSGREMKQQWVQIYTVEDGLITRMEEFASSESVPEE